MVIYENNASLTLTDGKANELPSSSLFLSGYQCIVSQCWSSSQSVILLSHSVRVIK